MKKFSIIILILLPFFLIYFVSLAGKIYSAYSSIELISMSIRDSDHTFEEGEILEMRVEESHYIEIEFNPDNASNKSYTVAKYDESVISYNNHGLIEAVGEGVTTLIFTSLSNSSIFTELTVHVRDDQLRDFTLPTSEINIKIGGKEQINPVYEPKNPVEEQKGFTYTSLDPSIATVDSNGYVTGVSEGETYIVVKSTYLGKEKQVKVKVSEHGAGSAYFNLEKEEGYSYAIWHEDTIELYDHITIVNGSRKDYVFDVTSANGVDTTYLESDGILRFTQKGVLVTVNLYRKTSDSKVKIDDISIKYIAN